MGGTSERKLATNLPALISSNSIGVGTPASRRDPEGTSRPYFVRVDC